MTVTDAYFVRGKISLEEVCELYHNLKYHEKESSAFIHARNHGVKEGYNEAIKEVIKLIDKAKEHGLDEFFPLFDDNIKKLKKVYGLS